MLAQGLGAHQRGHCMIEGCPTAGSAGLPRPTKSNRNGMLRAGEALLYHCCILSALLSLPELLTAFSDWDHHKGQHLSWGEPNPRVLCEHGSVALAHLKHQLSARENRTAVSKAERCRFCTLVSAEGCGCVCRNGEQSAKQNADAAVAYIGQLRRDLPPDAYEAMVNVLHHFRKHSLDICAVVDQVVDLLCHPGRDHLMKGFEQYLDKPALARFRNKHGTWLLLKAASQEGERTHSGACVLASAPCLLSLAEHTLDCLLLLCLLKQFLSAHAQQR